MSLFEALWRAGALRTLDHAFAQSLRRLDEATADTVLAAAALASLAVSQGHAALDLAQPGQVVEGHFEWPAAPAWQDALRASRWVDTPATPAAIADPAAPLVLEHGLLYLRRYREYERRLAAGLQRIAAQASPAPDAQALAAMLDALFPHREAGDRQAQAAMLALRRHLLLITGGPGTGKTTTIARLLVLLASQRGAQPAPRIALAAPTGRAAERMAESLRRARAQLAAQGATVAAFCEALPTGASTLHRLLGTIPDSPHFRHDADHPLPYEVIVVDEASMVDLPLMTKLVEAVADGARLILLGDPDQLPSVEAGDVLAAILRAAGEGNADEAPVARTALPAPAAPEQFALDFSAARTEAPPLAIAQVDAGTASPLAGARVHLQRGYRQDVDFDLAPLAAAVREGDAHTALSLLRSRALGGVQFHEGLADPLESHGDQLLAHWRALAAQDDPAQALALAAQLRLLTAVREGPQGARTLNARIEQRLQGQRTGLARGVAEEYFHGRLLQISQNSYRHRLFNGDIGVCLRDGQGGIAAWFHGSEEGGLRAFHPATLPAHESAFAMTVHKAQGSEFDSVWLLLPARDNRVLSRELIYTGLTRARRELHLAGSEAVIRQALARHASRSSGLGWRLGGVD